MATTSSSNNNSMPWLTTADTMTSPPSPSTTINNDNNNKDNKDDDSQEELMTPLMKTTTTATTTASSKTRLRKSTSSSLQEDDDDSPFSKPRRNFSTKGPLAAVKNIWRFWHSHACCCPQACRSLSHILAKATFWISLCAMVACVVWYSYELKNNGTDPHLIAWFSAGAFVLLGFPISMYGIVSHLANYNQPHVQCYIVRILWMVPIYSLESWLCLRFHPYAVYIETLRDCYEAYVLYNFLQFLIAVLGGQDSLILLLKDKSPTRGVHMWGLQWCVKPWLMGQPVKSTTTPPPEQKEHNSNNNHKRSHHVVSWTSPFLSKCKLGVLQYVLLKAVSSVMVMVLELHGWYKEGEFGYQSGYLYICILTNTSQCWALYCLIFFYYATKNELGPIRPVGKFLSVKALVFFTWWQSVGISLLYQAGMIPHYNAEWTSEDVAKGLQDYLICIEMFVGAIVHVFVFPHSDYYPQAVAARTRTFQQLPQFMHKKRLGRRHYKQHNAAAGGDFFDNASKCSNSTTANDLEMQVPTETSNENTSTTTTMATTRPGFVFALLDSTIPTDVMDHTVGIVKGEYRVEKKTLLHHAATHDQYDLFRASRRNHHTTTPTTTTTIATKPPLATTTDEEPVRKMSLEMQQKSEKEQQ